MSDQDAVLLNDFVGKINDSQKSDFPIVEGGEGSMVPVEIMASGGAVDSESVVGVASFGI